MGWPDQGLVLDVAVHIGTLFAVIIYFLKDVTGVFHSLFNSIPNILKMQNQEPEFWLFVKLLIATIPILIAGYFFNIHFSHTFRSLEVVGWTTLIFAILLLIADRTSMTFRTIDHMTFLGALIIGASQILALIPGTSRAGITITTARFQGLQRRDAARFSMLLSIPVIFSAGLLKGFELYNSNDTVLIKEAATVAVISFFLALTTIALLMLWLKRSNFTPFVIYRIFLGMVLLYISYWIPEFRL